MTDSNDNKDSLLTAPAIEAPAEPFTAEQFKSLNSAITSHNKKLEKNFEKMVSDALSKLTPKAPVPEKSEREIELENMLQAAEASKAQIQQEYRVRDADVSLKQQLLNASIQPEALDHAVAVLKYSQALSFDDEGNPLLTINGKARNLSDGVREWVKTPQAKFYLAAKGVSGAGSTETVAPKANQNLNTFNQVFKNIYK